ncbi:DNA-directed RNA polymerase subunit alpha C-terminal domain-containing protein [Streptosporangium sp. NPDC051022]|uniref:DNA-directed RNA polymerase subunit alpha C-terminal domain-containing protein n=1 Tax=Streptosporangium sp. NPDC051022 TaxID=3155752 RepID=UPI003416BF01
MTSIRDLVDQTGLPHDTRILRALTGLTWHVLNPLADAEIATLGRLAQQTDDDLLALPGLGKRRLEALRTELQRVARER